MMPMMHAVGTRLSGGKRSTDSNKMMRESGMDDIAGNGISNENTYNLKDTDIENQLSSHTSANVLCKFMDKFDYLRQIVYDLAIRPRYVEEKLDYLAIPEMKSIRFPMVCFCDIPFSKIELHTNRYGKYGIALRKSFCMGKDVQPILYINKKSRLHDDLSESYNNLFKLDSVPDYLSFLPDSLLSVLLYTKPISGYGSNSPDHRDGQSLYKDECEWRYIPEMPRDMPLILSPNDCTKKGMELYSKALGRFRNTWFRFGVDDIEYIIVPKEIDAVKMITEIRKMRKRDKREKDLLISKIEISGKFNENF